MTGARMEHSEASLYWSLESFVSCKKSFPVDFLHLLHAEGISTVACNKEIALTLFGHAPYCIDNTKEWPVWKAVDACTAKSQISAIKEVTEWLRDQSVPTLTGEPVVRSFFVPLYLDCSIKSSIKRLLTSCMQSLKDQYSDVTRASLHSDLAARLQTSDWSPEDRRALVDNCLSMLDNFPIGEEVLKSLCSAALEFLATSMDAYVEENKRLTSPVERSRNSHHCLVTVQVFNRLLQKCHGEVSTAAAQGGDRALCQTLAKAAHVCYTLLKSENQGLDLKSNSAMCSVLITKVLHGQETVTKLITEEKELKPGEKCGLCTTSYICWLNGATAMLGLDDLLAEVNLEAGAGVDGEECCEVREKYGLFVTHVIARQLLDIVDSLIEVSSKLMASRALLLLTSKISEALMHLEDKHPGYAKLCMLMEGRGLISRRLIGYAWDHWDDQVDAIRHNARNVFENTVTCHMRAQKQRPEESQFLQDLCDSLLAMTWHQKGRYGPLCCMVQHLGAREILRKRPKIAVDLLHCMGEQSLASHVSELFIKLVISYKMETESKASSCPNDSSGEFHRLWIDPVLDTLCSGAGPKRKFVIEYILGRLLKTYPACLRYMITRLCEKEGSDLQGDRLGSLMTCLKKARILGILPQLGEPKPTNRGKTTTGQNGTGETCASDILQETFCVGRVAVTEDLWHGVVPTDVVKKSLCHQNEQMRLDAYGLLCEHQRSTEAVTYADVQLVTCFLTHNLNSQEPAFRQSLLVFTKKLFVRMNDSWSVIHRERASRLRAEKDVTLQNETFNLYKGFLHWLCSLLFSSIAPDSSFPSRTTSLAVLHLLTQIFLSGERSDLLCEADLCTPERVHTLLQCLTDTFENNKIEVFGVLSALAGYLSTSQVLNNEHLCSLYNTATELACSTRPQDCTTAAYMFRFLVQLPRTFDIQTKMLRSAVNEGEGKNENTGEWRCERAVAGLLAELADEVAVAQARLLHAAATKPLYPALHCIRYLLAGLSLTCVREKERWRRLLADVVITCFTVAEVVSPVVAHCSPEGNIPEDAIMGPGLAIEAVANGEDQNALLQDVQQSENKVSLMPEYLVVCCWRSIKEVSLLLGQLTQTAPIYQRLHAEPSAPSQGLLDMEQIVAIGSYFTRQLLESRHRGAFELAYAGFVKMTETLWRCSIPEAQRLPRQWLEEIVNNIQTDGDQSKLCATRRSAGVPFYIQAVVSTEPTSNQRASLKWLMNQLIPLAVPSGEEGDMENTPQVHALNILRALYRDTRLGEDIFPYIADGIRAAILGYASKFWAIRNASTLLFSALVTRTFGVKRSKDEASKKNCMTARVFFRKLPQLYDFLLQQISQATQNIGNDIRLTLRPGLYPVLMVLSKLLPSATDDASTTTVSMRAFVPHVMRCAHSPVLKTRLMAARAIRPLVANSELSSTLSHLIGEITPCEGHVISHNYVHGVLLQIMFLLEDTDSLLQTTLESIVPFVGPKLWGLKQYASRTNRCFLTRKVALQIFIRVLELKCHEERPLQKHDESNTGSDITSATGSEGCRDRVMKKMACFVAAEMPAIFKASGNSSAPFSHPGLAEFHSDLALDYLLYVLHSKAIQSTEKEEAVVMLLQSDHYEVQLKALEILSCLLQQTHPNDVTDLPYIRSIPDQDVIQMLGNSPAICMAVTSILSVHGAYHECIVRSLEVLYHLEITPGDLTNGSCSSKKLLQLLVDYIQHCMDDVRSGALQLVGKLLSCCDVSGDFVREDMSEKSSTLIDWKRSVGESDAGEDHNESATGSGESAAGSDDVMTGLVAVLEERCGTQESVSCRLACARFLLLNAPRLRLAEPTDSLSVENVLRLWTVLMRLVQDEDRTVREAMATFFTRQSGEEPDPGPLHAPLALRQALVVMSRDVLPRLPVQTTDTLLLWIEQDLEQDWETEEKEVRLFDKGEMNTYRNEASFIGVLSEHMTQLFDAIFAAEADADRTLMDAGEELSVVAGCQLGDIMVSSEDKERLLTFLWNRYCTLGEELCSRLLWINTPAVADPFLKQSEYEGDCMYVLRKLTVMRILLDVLRQYAEEYHQEIAQADALFWADKVSDLLAGKYDVSKMNVGEVLRQEISRFDALKELIESQ